MIQSEKNTSWLVCSFRDGARESGIVTKTFDVQSVKSDQSPSEEHANRFIYELQQERKVNFVDLQTIR